MKKVLIITYYWPPMGGGGVQRWLKTVKYLQGYGWEPVIFTTKNGEASVVDEGMLKQIPKGIETIKVAIWEPFGLYKKLTGKKKGEKLTPGTVSEEGSSFMQKLSVWVRGNLFIPDARKFWIKPASKYLNSYLKNNKIDAIVSTGPPHTTHMIALNVARKNNIPWLADFRDPWTNIDFYDKLKLTNWADAKHKRLEQRVLNDANQVVTVSWSWAEDFYRISDRMPMVITNGYDPEDFVKAGTLTLDKKFTITHAGSLNDDRNPHSLWKALSGLCKDAAFKNDLEIKFIGQVSSTAINELTEAGLANNLNEIDNLPHKKVVNELMKSQVLLLPLNDTPNINGVVPGKLYEYIGAKRPIICIGKTDGDAAKIVNETFAGKVSGFEDVEILKETILDYYKEYKKNTLTIDSKDYEKYSRKLLAGQIAEELNKIID
ncbi:MAG: glycosyltransferase family 4 protein [Flavobacteriales bacterium]|nr:glycosyltransferase family 4 protein [Flavobacteriales bacterium]